MNNTKKILLAIGAATIPLIPYLYLRQFLKAGGLTAGSILISIGVGVVSYYLDGIVAIAFVLSVNILWRALLVRDVLKTAKRKEQEKEAKA